MELNYKTERCDVSGLRFSTRAIMECHEPHLVRRYGTGGVAHVSVWVCKKCRYAETYELHGGISCGLDKLQTREKSKS